MTIEQEADRLLNELLISFADMDDEAMIPVRTFMRGVGAICGAEIDEGEMLIVPEWETVGWFRSRIRARFSELARGLNLVHGLTP